LRWGQVIVLLRALAGEPESVTARASSSMLKLLLKRVIVVRLGRWQWRVNAIIQLQNRLLLLQVLRRSATGSSAANSGAKPIML
jgi:hypothetical protein